MKLLDSEFFFTSVIKKYKKRKIVLVLLMRYTGRIYDRSRIQKRLGGGLTYVKKNHKELRKPYGCNNINRTT